MIASFDLDLTGNIDLGTLSVALATLVLAFLTWRLARATAASVRVAQSSVDAERLGLEVSAMPFVVVAPRTEGGKIAPRRAVDQSDPHLQIQLRLLNIGSGPAIVEEIRLDSTQAWVQYVPNQIPLAAGATTDVSLNLKAWPETLGAQFRVRYRHSNGRGYVTVQDVRVLPDDLPMLTLVRKLDEGLMPGGQPFSFPMPEGTRRERDSPI